MLLVFAAYDAKALASIIAQQAYRGRLMYYEILMKYLHLSRLCRH